MKKYQITKQTLNTGNLDITALQLKETVIRLRVSKDLKAKFQAICKTKSINSSELLRQMITQWCYEQQRQ